MKRKLFSLLLCLLLLSVLPMPAQADEVFLVIDNADLLTAEEEESLSLKSVALRVPYQMDVVILTENSIGSKSLEEYADDYFDYNGYGLGPDRSGVLFLLSMEERDWFISTSGDAVYALTDYGTQASAEEALPYFSQGDYYSGFYAWLDVLPVYFDAFQQGQIIDGYADISGDSYYGTQEDVLYYEKEVTPSIFLSLVIGLIVGGATVLVMRFAMNTKRPQRSAEVYLTDGSYHLRTHQDMFLYSNVKKIPRPKDPPPSSGSSGGSRGGGSSVHRSSSGRTHGGGGGKF